MRRTPRRNTYTTAVGAKKDTLCWSSVQAIRFGGERTWDGGGGGGGVNVVRSEGSSEAGWGK